MWGVGVETVICCFWPRWAFTAAPAFLSLQRAGAALVAGPGLFLAVASYLQSTNSRPTAFSSCGSWARQLRLLGSRAPSQ